MKTLIAVAALAAAIASPAFAQTARQQSGPIPCIPATSISAPIRTPNIRFELLREQNWRNGGY